MTSVTRELGGVCREKDPSKWVGDVIRKIVVAYEPRWAIGPGKTPPNAEYIRFVSSFMKEEAERAFGFSPPVIYGGLVALTRFTGEIGFEPEGLRSIIEKYLRAL